MRLGSHSTKRPTKKRFQELQREGLRTLRSFHSVYPHEAKSEEMLRTHRIRIAVIARQGSLPGALRPQNLLLPLLGLTGAGFTLLVLYLHSGAAGLAELAIATLHELF